VMIVLLCGGDKQTQRADIKRALQLVQEYRL
jgi:putative component of toxin-antitoxin plasmid stabilization module